MSARITRSRAAVLVDGKELCRGFTLQAAEAVERALQLAHDAEPNLCDQLLRRGVRPSPMATNDADVEFRRWTRENGLEGVAARSPGLRLAFMAGWKKGSSSDGA